MVTKTNLTVGLTGSFGGLAQNDVIKQSADVIGTVGFANTTYVTIKHVSGTWQPSVPVYHALANTVANATITAVSNISQGIDDTEISYWTPVSCYDVEQENNEAAKTIRLLNTIYVDVIERDMRDLLST